MSNYLWKLLKVHFLLFYSPTSSALKTGRGEVPGSIPGCTRVPKHLKFSAVSSETCVNTGYDPLERSPTEGTLPTGPGPTSRQLALILQPNNNPDCYFMQFLTSNFKVHYTLVKNL